MKPFDHPVAPHLYVSDGVAAIEFYKRAFGAEELTRVAAQDGKRLMHAALVIHGGLVLLCDDFPEFFGGQSRLPKPGLSPVMVHLTVADVDTIYAKAIAAGSKATMPPADQFWGDRYGQLLDPFGHSWSLSTPKQKS